MPKQNKFKLTIPASEGVEEKIKYFTTSKEIIEFLELPSYNVLYNLSFRNDKGKCKFSHSSTKHLEGLIIERLDLKGTYPSSKRELMKDSLIEKKKDFITKIRDNVLN